MMTGKQLYEAHERGEELYVVSEISNEAIVDVWEGKGYVFRPFERETYEYKHYADDDPPYIWFYTVKGKELLEYEIDWKWYKTLDDPKEDNWFKVITKEEFYEKLNHYKANVSSTREVSGGSASDDWGGVRVKEIDADNHY